MQEFISKLTAPLRRSIPRPVVARMKQLYFRLAKNKLAKAISLSQAGQDFWVYGEAFNEATNGFFVDIGAHDGISISNSYILEKRYSWSGLCIEANPLTFALLKQNRSCKCINTCVDEAPGTVTFALRGVMGGIVSADCDNSNEKGRNLVAIDAIRLVDLFRKEGVPPVIDYLTIDIEGAEDRALLSFPFQDYTFNCITIERPSAQLRQTLQNNGYVLVREVPDLDCFYIHSSFQERYEKNRVQFISKGLPAPR